MVEPPGAPAGLPVRASVWKNTRLRRAASSSAKRRCSVASTVGVVIVGGATGWPLFCAPKIGRPRSPGSGGPRTGPV